ncbi:MAG: 2'-5' RNA ligase family protein [Haloferacaceae archaeon]
MFSINVPTPPAVERLADRLQPQLVEFDRVRERHTLLCKRLGVDAFGNEGGPPEKETALSRLREELRPLIGETRPFQVEITGIDAFAEPTAGPGPVVYLTVESDGLLRLHWRLVRAFGAVEGLEGEEYVPHVTLARGLERGIGKGTGVETGRGIETGRGVETGRDVDAVLERLREAAGDVDVRWRVDELDLWDPEFRVSAGRIRL